MKNRHIRTAVEKYGLASVKKEAQAFLETFKPYERDSFEIFEQMPHLGILYVPYEQPFLELIYSGEEGELLKEGREFKKFKVLEVTENDWTVSHWDDHHHHIVIWKRKHDKFLIEGNQLIENGNVI